MTPMREQRGAVHGTGRRAWPRWLRRGILENVATILIAAGVLMLLQPFSLTLYGYSFVTTLAGVAMFTIVTKVPE
jgi:hypothetical protein